jgi:hypothetical protein
MDTSRLDNLLNRKFSDLRTFRENQDVLWQLVNAGYLVSEGLIKCTALLLSDPTIVETHRTVMWWTVLDYQMEAFFLCINRQLDLSLASLRMASELTRDIVRVGSDEKKLSIWLGRIKGSTRKEYRKSFRFDDSDSIENLVHKLYDLASDFSVHGHVVRSASMKPSKSVNAGEHVVLEVPDIEVFKILEVWLTAFYPIHALCSRCFMAERGDELEEAYGHFKNMWEAFNPALEDYRRNIREDEGYPPGTIQ